MRNNPILFGLIFTAIILLIDFYSYKGVKKLIIDLNPKIKKIIKILLWIVPIILIVSLIMIPILRDQINPAHFLIYIHFISGTFTLFYIPKLIFIVFNFIDDVSHGTIKLFARVKRGGKTDDRSELKKITRSQFLTRVGIIMAGIPFLSIAYGIGWGRYDLTVRKVKLNLKNLPPKFNGLKIIQISDFHLGSLLNHKGFVEEAVEVINSQKPDIIFFTGDLVNNTATELKPFVPVLSRLKSRIGNYSVLGNHDYGDYIPWDSEEAKSANMDSMKKMQVDSGFDLILNDSRSVSIDAEEISIIGVENWGLPPFPQYGDLKNSLKKIDKDTFKILLSHDPTHWDEQVLGYTDIDLTLSGHTHGAQFGIEIPGWRWSPVNMRYKRWGGLYSENGQHLYVNTGIGFIGFPGRVGMPPEITVLELSSMRA